ncbi:MAG: hypothetical protein BWK78_05220 [Thiotrichaceae bacterium IS1]|nr:MAG: hypothetical protein BWK78_05220 [Thiotrichaceae bacterium IS1]
MFDLTPLLQSEDMGLREIEIWVKATPGCSSGEKLTDLDNRENISNENQETDNSTKGTLSSSSAKTEKVIPGQAKKISHEEAELDINAEAVTVEKDLTIDALNDTNSESYFIC